MNSKIRETSRVSVRSGPVERGGKINWWDRWVSLAGFGYLTPTASLILAPHGGFAQQGWPCGARQERTVCISNAAARYVLDPRTRSSHYWVMSERNSIMKERVRVFWQENPCGTKFAYTPPGSRRFYELVEEHRYRKEWHIPTAAGFAEAKDLAVLEVGCGLGTDGAQFAKAGANYTGIDLTDAAVDLAKRRFEIFQLPGSFRVADAEHLDFR